MPYLTQNGPYYQGCNIEVIAEALDDLAELNPEAYSQRVAKAHTAIKAALHGQITPADLVIWLVASAKVNPTKPE